MFRLPASLSLLVLAVLLTDIRPTQAALRYRHVSIRAAAQLCGKSQSARSYRIAVTGFFRPGSENNGPDPINGALFDSNRVPQNAALHISKYHGILFLARVGWKYSGNIHGATLPGARVSVSGVMSCPGVFLRPEAITVRR